MSSDAFNLTEEELKTASDWLEEIRILIEQSSTKIMLAANSALFVVYFAQQTIGLHWNVVLDVMIRNTKNRETVIAFYVATLLAEEISEPGESDEQMVNEITRWMATILAYRASVNALNKKAEEETKNVDKKVPLN